MVFFWQKVCFCLCELQFKVKFSQYEMFNRNMYTGIKYCYLCELNCYNMQWNIHSKTFQGQQKCQSFFFCCRSKYFYSNSLYCITACEGDNCLCSRELSIRFPMPEMFYRQYNPICLVLNLQKLLGWLIDVTKQIVKLLNTYSNLVLTVDHLK